jgi:predicted metal-dependent enzyme (double-stranded beta helix superfamily)
MILPETRDLVQRVQRAGYDVIAIEHPRSTRWLLTLQDSTGTSVILIVQAPSVISSSDVQDLDELVRVRRSAHGVLWAYNGDFTPAARRTRDELGESRLTLCRVWPTSQR